MLSRIFFLIPHCLWRTLYGVCQDSLKVHIYSDQWPVWKSREIILDKTPQVNRLKSLTNSYSPVDYSQNINIYVCVLQVFRNVTWKYANDALSNQIWTNLHQFPEHKSEKNLIKPGSKWIFVDILKLKVLNTGDFGYPFVLLHKSENSVNRQNFHCVYRNKMLYK